MGLIWLLPQNGFNSLMMDSISLRDCSLAFDNNSNNPEHRKVIARRIYIEAFGLKKCEVFIKMCNKMKIC